MIPVSPGRLPQPLCGTACSPAPKVTATLGESHFRTQTGGQLARLETPAREKLKAGAGFAALPRARIRTLNRRGSVPGDSEESRARDPAPLTFSCNPAGSRRSCARHSSR